MNDSSETRRRKIRQRPKPTSLQTIHWMKKRNKGNYQGIAIKTEMLASQKAYLQRMFNIFDRSGDGSIDLTELQSALLDYGFSEHKAEEYLDVFANLPSVQDDGEISFDEFLNCMGTSSVSKYKSEWSEHRVMEAL